MPLVRNESGREHVVPAGHWSLVDPTFVVLPEPAPEPETEPAPPPRRAPAPKRK